LEFLEPKKKKYRNFIDAVREGNFPALPTRKKGFFRIISTKGNFVDKKRQKGKPRGQNTFLFSYNWLY